MYSNNHNSWWRTTVCCTIHWFHIETSALSWTMILPQYCVGYCTSTYSDWSSTLLLYFVIFIVSPRLRCTFLSGFMLITASCWLRLQYMFLSASQNHPDIAWKATKMSFQSCTSIWGREIIGKKKNEKINFNIFTWGLPTWRPNPTEDFQKHTILQARPSLAGCCYGNAMNVW